MPVILENAMQFHLMGRRLRTRAQITKSLISFARWGAVVALLCLCLPCYAQFSSNVQGTVTDSSGAVIPKAAITLHNVNTGINLLGTTNATGYYRFTSVAPGSYDVTATEAGFKAGLVSVTVSPGETRGADITLTPGTATIAVAVSDVAETLNPEETRIVQTLTERDQPVAVT
jgi:hypothetical protein